MAKLIPKEELQRFEAWPVPAVESLIEDEPEVPEEEAELRPPTAEEIEAIESQAHEEGYARGLREGLEAGRQEIEQRVAKLDSILALLHAPLQQIDDEVENELVELSMLVARQLVRREIKTQPEQIMGVIRESIQLMPAAARNVRLHLHPDDAALVREYWSEPGSEPGWKIMEDPALTRGGCQVRSDSSQIDASLESRLNAVIAAVLGGEREGDR